MVVKYTFSVVKKYVKVLNTCTWMCDLQHWSLRVFNTTGILNLPHIKCKFFPCLKNHFYNIIFYKQNLVSTSSPSRACLLATHPQVATPSTTTSFLRPDVMMWSLTASPTNSITPVLVPPVMIQAPVTKKDNDIWKCS